jgi:uncharacterized membrane protein required for colicin V production
MKTEKIERHYYATNRIIGFVFSMVTIVVIIMYGGWKIRDMQVQDDLKEAREIGYITGLKDAENGNAQLNSQINKQGNACSAEPKLKERKALVKR